MSLESTAVSWNGSSPGTESPLFVDPEEAFDAVQDILGRKWHLRIVYHLLENGPIGFSGLKSEIAGVSSKMLSESLSRLEEDGVVERKIVSDQPLRVEYSLTERGRDLEPIVSGLVTWVAESEAAREGE